MSTFATSLFRDRIIRLQCTVYGPRTKRNTESNTWTVPFINDDFSWSATCFESRTNVEIIVLFERPAHGRVRGQARWKTRVSYVKQLSGIIKRDFRYTQCVLFKDDFVPRPPDKFVWITRPSKHNTSYTPSGINARCTLMFRMCFDTRNAYRTWFTGRLIAAPRYMYLIKRFVRWSQFAFPRTVSEIGK